MKQNYDVLVIGGGINGCGCAHDAALRGLSVLLCEKDDLASKTSSCSTKLIHGGLRYLEQYDFKLVKKALEERQILLGLAPHLVHPLPIFLPYQKTMRPAWLLRLGLFFYDYLSRKNSLPRSALIQRMRFPNYFSSLKEAFQKGFLFYDGITDDARLTVVNAISAKNNGATILTRAEVIAVYALDQQWQVTIKPHDQPAFQVLTKAIINAAGPWVPNLHQLFKIPLAHEMSLIKGSHLVVHQLYEGEHAYLLQHYDNRIVFVIPYHHHTLIGTTDVAYSDALDDVSIDANEVKYLCDLVNHYFNKTLKPADIIRSWSGIRPLLKEKGKKPSKLSRDYAFHSVSKPAPMVTIYSGKITTYRKVAKEVVEALRPIFPDMPDSKTEHDVLPGAMLGEIHFEEYKKQSYEKYYWLDENLLTRYLNNYGTRMELFLQSCQGMQDLGICFTGALYQKEVDYLIEHEWAYSVEDILWRRTKLGLTIDLDGQARLNEYMMLRRA